MGICVDIASHGFRYKVCCGSFQREFTLHAGNFTDKTAIRDQSEIELDLILLYLFI